MYGSHSMIYRELKDLKKEVESIRSALVPEEMLNENEIKDILQIEKEMEQGKYHNIESFTNRVGIMGILVKSRTVKH